MRFFKIIYDKCNVGVLRETKRGLRMHSRIGPTVEDVALIRHELFDGLSKERIYQRQKFPIPVINNASVRAKRTALFQEEKERQFNEVGRIEKIDVEFQGEPEGKVTLMMNKGISTPFHVAQHLSELHVKRSIVAETNGQLWDMNRPLEDNSKLRFLHMKMKDEDPFQVNRVFWRSCSMMLGYVAERAFQDHIYVELHSFPPPNVRSGSFIYDVDIKLKDWRPNSDEMRVFSGEFRKLVEAELQFERLEVHQDLASKIFEDNQYKKQQIPIIASGSPTGNTVIIYRIGDFVDISKGPLMSNTSQVSRATVASLIPLDTNISPTLYRFQGVALPADFLLNHFAWGLIENRGKKMNSAKIPGGSESANEQGTQNIDSNKRIEASG
ncbi:unnamed protein product [Allacma fusca]|uniref:TGS domain-containing protein n=1 Tax=Allacma fusca TaxID=39272 RepID=A0A8J2LZB4_9HEXA|nr:unnamed protein product [Allacma fusca]